MHFFDLSERCILRCRLLSRILNLQAMECEQFIINKECECESF